MKPNNGIIRVGIDLGTTNSEIAINDGLNIEIINNIRGDLYTPSVFGFNKGGNEVIGKEAYVQLFNNATKEEAKNYKAEIKRDMGEGIKIAFPRSDKTFSPEEISAEILKTLKNDALRRFGDLPVQGVVITVPAYFNTVQSEATKRAGKLAGFDHIVLLQEPIAAAIAYGLTNEKDENWLVYDLGGGTFDVALISSKEGVIRVVEHGGDNYLGGKDIDWLIVERVIKPKIMEQYSFKDFSKKKEKYFAAHARLKAIAEESKIKLSSLQEVDISIDDLKITDDNGKTLDIFFKFTRKQLEKLIEELVDKTIVMTKQVIEKSKMKISSIAKVIFVGAMTQAPYIKYKVEKELGLTVDASVNPFTVVARGAALFGLGQRIPQEIIDKEKVLVDGEVRVELFFDAMTAEDEQLITGKITTDIAGDLFIRISSDSGFYHSDKIKISNNTFFAKVSLEHKRSNLFWLYLIDDSGNNLNITPNSFVITQCISVMGAPIPHSIGVIYSAPSTNHQSAWEDKCEPYFERNSVPPLSETKTFKTIKQLNKGEESILPIIVYEGDDLDPKLNLEITRIGIDGKLLPFNLSKGEDVEIKMLLSEARELEVEVYIPVCDVTLNARVDVYSKEIKHKQLIEDISLLKSETKAINDSISDDERNLLRKDIADIEESIKNNDDTDSKNKALRDINEVKRKIAKLKEGTAFKRKLIEYEKALKDAKTSVDEIDTDDDEKKNLLSLIEKVEANSKKAIKEEKEKDLEQQVEQLKEIAQKARTLSPAFWFGLLMYIEANKQMLTSQSEGNLHINKAKEAVSNNDFEGLKEHVIALIQLVSREKSEYFPMNIAGITK